MFKLLAIYISLLTCSPGDRVYEHYGHTSIRVVDTERHIDWIYNYGVFTFNTDHFYAKFVKGETYYQLGKQRTEDFVADFVAEGRTIYEQELNLNEEQKQWLINALEENYLPSKRFYLYNFVFDNCATRPYNMIRRAFNYSIESNYKGWEGESYRKVLNHYTDPGSWVGFAINMIFGHRANTAMNGEQRFFLPEILMHGLEQATTADGTPIVAGPTRNMLTGKEYSPGGAQFAIPATPWYKTWYFGWFVFVIVMWFITFLNRLKGQLNIAIDITLGIIYLIPILIATYLTFFSLHPLVGYNFRLLIFPITHVCIRLLYLRR